MKKLIKIDIPDDSNIFKHLARILFPYREKPPGSYLFIVEGTLEKPRVGIRYPGRKLVKRRVENPRTNSILWANLFDFEVIPFEKRKEGSSVNFTYANLLKDFEVYKKDDESFWKMIVKVHDRSVIDSKPPKLGGINSRQFLEMLKWMWIQEDFNYRLSWQECESEVRYRLQNKNGGATSRGAGRDKFYAALILVHENHFDAASMRKIIP